MNNPPRGTTKHVAKKKTESRRFWVKKPPHSETFQTESGTSLVACVGGWGGGWLGMDAFPQGGYSDYREACFIILRVVVFIMCGT